MSYEEVMARLNPRVRNLVHSAQETQTEKIPLASLGLTMDLAGGLGKGRQSIVWGSKSAGKTALCLQSIGDAQKAGMVCAWIDAEAAYDPVWAARLGVSSDELIISTVKSTADMTDVACELLNAEVDILVVDSISSLLSSAYFTDKDELKNLDNTKQIGSDARDLGNAVRMMNYANKSTALVLISQLRNKMNQWGAMPAPTGGEAVKFFSSTIVKLWANASEKEQITRQVKRGDKLFDEPQGREVRYTVEYNKMGPPNRTGTYNFYYAGEDVGVDIYSEIVRLGVRYGIITKGGAWFNIGDEKIQGELKAAEYLKNNQDVYARVREQISDAVG